MHCSEAIKETWPNASLEDDTANVNANDNDLEEEDDDIEKLERMRRKKQKSADKHSKSTDPAVKCVEEFFGQHFNAKQAIAKQQDRPGSWIGNTPAEWIENIEAFAKHFDPIDWWEEVGRQRFPLMYPVAMRALSLPDSNGDQERTFSCGTWMDGKLSTRQSDATFEQKVLIKKNADFIQQHRDNVKGEFKMASELKTKKLLVEHMKNKKEDLMDSEDDDVMDAYGIEEVEKSEDEDSE